MEKWRVIIEPGSQSPDLVVEQLTGLGLPADGISVELREPPLAFRGADPAIIVATIGALSANLTAVITGLLQLRGSRKDQRISLELASGEKIDIPVGIPPAELDRLIKSLSKEPQRLILP